VDVIGSVAAPGVRKFSSSFFSTGPPLWGVTRERVPGVFNVVIRRQAAGSGVLTNSRLANGISKSPFSQIPRTSKLDFNFGFCDVYPMLRSPQTEVTRRFRR
jgi:hypothetical protein